MLESAKNQCQAYWVVVPQICHFPKWKNQDICTSHKFLVTCSAQFLITFDIKSASSFSTMEMSKFSRETHLWLLGFHLIIF